MFKKILLVSLAAATVAFINPVGSQAVYAATDQSSTANKSVEGFEYKISSGKVTITAYKGSDKTVKIPSKIEGSNVTAIGNEAFKGNTTIKEVTVSSKVTKIGKSAFSGCSKLKTISIPATLTDVKENAFRKASKLEKVNYAGSEDDWKKIDIDDGNDYLTDATINYNIKNGKKLKYPKTKDDFKVSYTSKLTFSGHDPRFEDFGDITVKFNGETYEVSEIKINKDIKKFQIRELKSADDDIEKAVKNLTKGENGMSFSIKPYKVTSDDSVSVKMKGRHLKRVKILLDDDYYKVSDKEYDYDKKRRKITFKGDHFKGSYKIQDEDVE